MILGKTRTFRIFFLIFILKFSVVCSTEIKKNNDIDSINLLLKKAMHHLMKKNILITT